MSVVGMAGEAASTPEQIKKQLEGGEKSPEERVSELDDPRLKPRWEFEFSYQDGRGRTWRGTFTNQILNVIETSRVAAIRSTMLGHAPVEAIDSWTFEHTERLAHMTVSLIRRASWAEGDKLGQLYDPVLIAELYRRVASHEAIFRGREPNQGIDPSGAADPTGKASGVAAGQE